MHVAIIDCAVVGATLALQFVKAGFQVTVLERQLLPARETGMAGASREGTGRRPM
jgi:2-polyprenyl-6-methoxyphenol hydroxylase-like FAD-dependent oxidoreductase